MLTGMLAVAGRYTHCAGHVHVHDEGACCPWRRTASSSPAEGDEGVQATSLCLSLLSCGSGFLQSWSAAGTAPAMSHSEKLQLPTLLCSLVDSSIN